MITLRIEHPIKDFDSWKKAFESDPIDRRNSGVRAHRIYRPVDDPRFVMIELDFGARAEADACLEALRKLWGRVEGTIITDPRTRITEMVESKSY